MVIQAKDDRTKRSDLGLDEKRIVDLVERLKPLLDRIDALPRKRPIPDKRFFDDLWGEGDD